MLKSYRGKTGRALERERPRLRGSRWILRRSGVMAHLMGKKLLAIILRNEKKPTVFCPCLNAC